MVHFEPAAAAAPNLPTEAATFQWGEKAPTCAVVFGGLNSMYVNPEVWMLPMRWGEKAVQFFPPNPEPEPQEEEDSENARGGIHGELGGLGFATAVRLKRAAALAASSARRKVAAAAGAGGAAGGGAIADDGETGVDAWRLFEPGGAGGEKGAGKRSRRASLPGGFSAGGAALGFEVLRPHQEGQRRKEQGEDAANRGGSGGGVLRPGDDGGGGGDGGGMLESAAEIEVSPSMSAPGLCMGAR